MGMSADAWCLETGPALVAVWRNLGLRATVSSASRFSIVLRAFFLAINPAGLPKGSAKGRHLRLHTL